LTRNQAFCAKQSPAIVPFNSIAQSGATSDPSDMASAYLDTLFRSIQLLVDVAQMIMFHISKSIHFFVWCNSRARFINLLLSAIPSTNVLAEYTVPGGSAK
jgi:hypothetical protein